MLSTGTEEEKAKAEIEKLQAETAMLQDENEHKKKWKWLSRLTGIGGVLSVLIAAGTVIVTSLQWRAEFSRERSVRVGTTFDGALARLALPEPGGRTIGVITLESFLTKSHPSRHRQVILALCNSLATESEGTVRRAILSAFSDLSPGAVSIAILNKGVDALVDMSRSADDVSESFQAESVGFAIVELLRAGATVTDFEGANCAGCDFSDLSLRGAIFDDADLSSAKFCGADLVGASFHRADLHRTDFFSADLRESTFSHTPRGSVIDHPSEHFVEKLFKRLSAGEDVVIYGPSFDCTDLSGADFSGFPSIVLAPAGTTGLVQMTFKGAKLDGTKLNRVHYYGIRQWKDEFPASFTGTEWSIDLKGPELAYDPNARLVYFDEASSLSRSELDVFDLSRLAVAFSGSNWRDARLPSALEELFISSPPSQDPVLAQHERGCDD